MLNKQEKEIINQTTFWVKKEKEATAKLLKLLVKVEERKLYTELKYSSLHKFLVKYYKYSDAQAVIRVNAVRLMMKVPMAKEKIESGKLSLSNASTLYRGIKNSKQELTQSLMDALDNASSRQGERIVRESLKLELPKSKQITLHQATLAKLEKIKKYYSDQSDAEVIDILLDEKLKQLDSKKKSRRSNHNPNSRTFSIKDRRSAKPVCVSCGEVQNIQFDHRRPYALGGKSTPDNLRVLCQSCNQRKAILSFKNISKPGDIKPSKREKCSGDFAALL